MMNQKEEDINGFLGSEVFRSVILSLKTFTLLRPEINDIQKLFLLGCCKEGISVPSGHMRFMILGRLLLHSKSSGRDEDNILI